MNVEPAPVNCHLTDLTDQSPVGLIDTASRAPGRLAIPLKM